MFLDGSLRQMRALQADIFETVEDLANDPIRTRKIGQRVLQILQGYTERSGHFFDCAGTSPHHFQHALTDVRISLQPAKTLEPSDDFGCVSREELSHGFHPG